MPEADEQKFKNLKICNNKKRKVARRRGNFLKYVTFQIHESTFPK